MLKGQLGGLGTTLTVPGYPLKDKSFSPGFYQNGLFEPSLTLKKMPLLVLTSCRTIIQGKKKIWPQAYFLAVPFSNCVFCL